MKAVKVEDVQIKLEPSTTPRPRNAAASSNPNISYLSGARKGSDRPSAAPGEEGVLKSEDAPRTKRRRKVEEPGVKIESDLEPHRVESEAISITPSSPFPDFLRPTPEECRAARDALALLHGEPQQHRLTAPGKAEAAADSLHTHSQQTVLDSLVRTILSQNTTDVTSHRAFASLKAAFPGDKGWEAVLRAPPGRVEEAIRMGGLADIKAERIKAMLATLLEERGRICMEYLRDLSDDRIKAELSRFKGVGKKTVACVLMFCLAREEFPVDTHVWRISKSLGWVPAKASRDAAYEHLNVHVPPDVRYDLHVLMVEHGKRCPRCASNGKPRKEAHGDCPLRNLKELAARVKLEKEYGFNSRGD